MVVPPAARAFFLAGMASRAKGPVLAIVPGERDAEELKEDLALFHSAAVLMPAWETLPSHAGCR
jgi:transcription-repair coupling factor (superfamily II helicase)